MISEAGGGRKAVFPVHRHTSKYVKLLPLEALYHDDKVKSFCVLHHSGAWNAGIPSTTGIPGVQAPCSTEACWQWFSWLIAPLVCHLVPFSTHAAPPFIHSLLSLWGLRLWPLPPERTSSSPAHASSSPHLHPLPSIPVIFPNSVWETKFLHYLPQFLQIKIFLLETSWNNSWSFLYYSTKFKQTLAEFFIGLAQLLRAVWVMEKLLESFLDT